MARANTIQTNFTAGEISPLMYGRVDVNKYFNGARKLQNIVVLPQGGAFRRPGTAYRGEVKTSANYTILRKFVFSSTQAYVLEFGNQYIRFWGPSGPILVTGTPYEISSPYVSADLPYLCFAQSGDLVYITHGSYSPRKLSRFSSTSWTLTEVAFEDGPYLDIDDSGNNVKVSVTSDVVTLVANTSGTTTATATTAIFSQASVGKFVEYVIATDGSGNVTTWGLDQVTAYTNTTHVDVVVLDNIISPGPLRTITFSAGQVHSSGGFTAMFNAGSVGRYIRLTNSQAWYLVTAFVNGTTCSATAVSMVTYTYPTTVVTNQATFNQSSVGKYVEFKSNGAYQLSKILSVISETRATVSVLPNIVIPPPQTQITVSVGFGYTTSSNSGVFVPSDVGKYVRDTVSQRWGKITGWNSSSQVATDTSFTTMFAYTFPGLTMTLLNDRTITVSVVFKDSTLSLDDVGTNIRVKYGTQWRWIKITSVLSEKQATGTLSDFQPYDPMRADVPFNNGYADLFRLSVWSVTNGWPSICCFHQGRLVFASNTLKPTTLWFSEVDSYESMAPTDPDGAVLDTNSITVTIANNQINKINWMKSGPVLLIGTQGDEFQVKPSSINQSLTPTNITIINQTSFGAIDTDKAARINSQTLFVQRGGLKIREMAYNFNIDAFDSRDISIISEHLFRNATPSVISGNPLTANSGLVQLDVGHYPVTFGWAVMADGTLLGITYEREQDVIAFHSHIIGGSGKVESVCVIPDGTSGTDIIWMVVARTIGGVTKRYVESFTTLEIFSGANYMDSWKVATTQTGNIDDAIGFDHLNGATVQVMLDGLCIGNKTVGTTTTPVGKGFNLKYNTSASIVAGFQCSSIVGVLDPEGGSQAGSSQAKKKKVNEIAVRIVDSPHMKVAFGSGDTNEQQTIVGWKEPVSADWDLVVPNQVVAAAGTVSPFPSAGTAPTQYTADVLITPDDSFNNGGRFHLVQDDPYPLRINCLILKLDTNE